MARLAGGVAVVAVARKGKNPTISVIRFFFIRIRGLAAY
jgi:hypothetical protein